MSRPLRLELAGGLYHITSRGDRREDIYLDDVDRQRGDGVRPYILHQRTDHGGKYV